MIDLVGFRQWRQLAYIEGNGLTPITAKANVQPRLRTQDRGASGESLDTGYNTMTS